MFWNIHQDGSNKMINSLAQEQISQKASWVNNSATVIIKPFLNNVHYKDGAATAWCKVISNCSGRGMKHLFWSHNNKPSLFKCYYLICFRRKKCWGFVNQMEIQSSKERSQVIPLPRGLWSAYILWSVLVGSMPSHVTTVVRHEGQTISGQENVMGRLETLSHMPDGHN